MKISFSWGDTGEAWSPLFPIEDPPSRSIQTCLEDLISDVKQGAHVLCLSPAALLETISPYPRLHGAWCNSIFFLTAGKENQVIKCEKSPTRGALSAWVDFPTQLPSRKSQKPTWGRTARLWTKAWHCLWMHRVPNTVCCQELTSQPCPAQVALLPISLKRLAGEEASVTALCFTLLAPLSRGRRSWAGGVTAHQKKTRGGGTGGWKQVWGCGRGLPWEKSVPQPGATLVTAILSPSFGFSAFKSIFAPHFPLPEATGHHGYDMHKILVLRNIYLRFAKTCSRIQILCIWVIKSHHIYP